MSNKNIKEFFAKYYRHFIICGLFLVLVIVLIVVVAGKKNDKTSEEEGLVSTIPELETTVEVPKDKYEKDSFQDVNSLVKAYLDAMSIGDIDTMDSLSSSMSDDMKAFYEAQAKYLGNYSNYHVYTKVGPKENSYFLLATYDLTINGQTETLPALLSLYVCKNDSGSLYVNCDNLSSEDEAYILEEVAQSDFAELIDQVEVDYNAKLEANSNLASAAKALKEEINKDAQNILTAKQQSELEAAAAAEAAAQQEAKEAAATQVRCNNDNVNIRSKPSTEGDSLGKTSKGDIYTRYEAMDNGWSKIDYNGTEAYIKSDYLEPVEDSSESKSEESTSEAKELTPGSKITVKENVNVRKSPSETGEKISTAYRGEQFELVEVKDGWCKIKYKGDEAYVKADYVE